MKKLFTMACCFVLLIGVMTGCGGNRKTNPTDMTTKPTTSSTEPAPSITTQPTENTLPSTIPDSGSMPSTDSNTGTGNDWDGNADKGPNAGIGSDMGRGSSRTQTHAPSIIGKGR